MRWVVLCGIVVAANGCVGKPPVARGAEVVNYPTVQDRLPNGLGVVVEESPPFGNTGAVMLIDAGARYEPAARAGLAHLVEHLVFRAKHGDAKTVWQKLGDLGGGAFNAGTSWDAVSYHAFVPQQNLDELLELFARIVANPLEGVDESDFEHERQIVMNEMRLRDENGTPRQAIGWLAAQVFDRRHPYSRPVGGTVESLRAATLEDARTFAREHYSVAGATIAVAAPFRRDITTSRVRRVFADLKPGQRPLLAKFPASGSGAGALPPALPEYRAAVAAPTIWIGWALPGAQDASADIAPLLANMVEGTFFFNVDERDPDIARVEAGVDAGADGTLLYLQVTLNRGLDPRASADSVLREMRRGMADRAYHYELLDIYKRSLAIQSTYAEESPPSRLSNLAHSAHLHKDPRFLRDRGRRILSVDASALSAFWGQHLTSERARAVVVRPLPETERAAIGATGLGTSYAASETPEVPPEAAELKSWMQGLVPPSARRMTLENGLELIVVPRPKSVFQTALAGFRGGTAFGPVPGAAIAALWGELHHGYRLPSTLGAQHSRTVSADATVEVVRLTGNDVDMAVDLVSEVMKGGSTRWPTREFTKQMELFEKEYALPQVALDRARRNALFGGHPYGATASPADVHEVRGNQVYDWKDLVRRPENGVLILSGDFTPEAAFEAVRSRLSTWQRSAQRKPANVAPPALERTPVPASARVLFRHRPGSTQARLALSCLLPAVTEHNRTALELFGKMLERHWFGQLRERALASYAVNAWVDWHWGGTAELSAMADIEHTRLVPALGVVRRYLELDSATHFTSLDLGRERAAMAREYGLRYSTTEAVARDAFQAWLQGWSPDSLQAFPDRLLATELQHVLAAADHCRHNAVLALLGEESALRAAWSQVQSTPLVP